MVHYSLFRPTPVNPHDARASHSHCGIQALSRRRLSEASPSRIRRKRRKTELEGEAAPSRDAQGRHNENSWPTFNEEQSKLGHWAFAEEETDVAGESDPEGIAWYWIGTHSPSKAVRSSPCDDGGIVATLLRGVHGCRPHAAQQRGYSASFRPCAPRSAPAVTVCVAPPVQAVRRGLTGVLADYSTRSTTQVE